MHLPHTFPFRWIDRVSDGVARVELSANSFWLRGGSGLAAPFCAEIFAQAAALLLAPAREPVSSSRWLAGIENLTLERPLLAGEQLEVHVATRARFGAVIQVEGELRSPAGVVARGSVLLA